MSIQFSKNDTDIFNRIMFLKGAGYEYNEKDFKLVDRGNGTILTGNIEFTKQQILAVNKSDADSKITKSIEQQFQELTERVLALESLNGLK